jgi:glycine betaine transporter
VVRAGEEGTPLAFGALDWFFMATVSAFVVLGLWLALSRHGRLCLGEGGPEFSTASWLAMLFASGMGTGLVVWGAAEPLVHYLEAPGAEPRTEAAADNAMLLTSFHWGLHAWGVYCIGGLCLAYFGFRRGAPYLPGAPIRAVFRGAWVRPVAFGGDLVAVIAIALGVAGSIAMGAQQIRTGLHRLAGAEPESWLLTAGILGALVTAYMISASTGLNAGIKWLSNINMVLAIALMLFVLAVGPTTFALRTLVTSVGEYASSIVPLSFNLRTPTEERTWFEGWTLTYFVWWIAWAPFVGVFIARISRGRTIREFVIGVLAAPTGFTLLWFGILGGSALHAEMYGATHLADRAGADVTLSLYALFETLPMSDVLSGLAILVVFAFLVTSVDSATFVLGMLTSGGGLEPPATRKVAWGLSLGLLGAAMTFAGDFEVVRACAILGAIPYTFVMVLSAVALVWSVVKGER